MFYIKFVQEHGEKDGENAEKCFSLFIKNQPKKKPDSQYLTQEEIGNIFATCIGLIMALMGNEALTEVPVPPSLLKIISENSLGITDLAKLLSEVDDNDESLEKITKYFESLALTT